MYVYLYKYTYGIHAWWIAPGLGLRVEGCEMVDLRFMEQGCEMVGTGEMKWSLVDVKWAGFHRRPFVGVSRPRSWSCFLVFVGNCCQKLTNLVEIDY